MADVVKIVATGRSIITNRLRGQGTEPNYLAIGTGTNAPVDGNTVLETPRAESRVGATTTTQTTSTTGDTYRAVGQITISGTSAAVTEVGLFDASSSGNLFLRATHDVINLSVNDQIQYTTTSNLHPLKGGQSCNHCHHLKEAIHFPL